MWQVRQKISNGECDRECLWNAYLRTRNKNASEIDLYKSRWCIQGRVFARIEYGYRYERSYEPGIGKHYEAPEFSEPNLEIPSHHGKDSLPADCIETESAVFDRQGLVARSHADVVDGRREIQAVRLLQRKQCIRGEVDHFHRDITKWTCHGIGINGSLERREQDSE